MMFVDFYHLSMPFLALHRNFRISRHTKDCLDSSRGQYGEVVSTIPHQLVPFAICPKQMLMICQFGVCDVFVLELFDRSYYTHCSIVFVVLSF